MSIKSNAKEVAKNLDRDIAKLMGAIPSDLQEWGNDAIEYAKTLKPYKRRDGNLDRAQKADVSGFTVHIWIDPSMVTNDGYNYGLIQHNGSKKVKGYPWLFVGVEYKTKDLTNMIAKTIKRIL